MKNFCLPADCIVVSAVFIMLTDIRDQVENAGLNFMFKHWPGISHNVKEALLEGKTWNEYPESIQVNMDWD